MIYSTNIRLFLHNISFFLKKDLFIFSIYKEIVCFYSVVLSHLLLLLITVYNVHITLQFII